MTRVPVFTNLIVMESKVISEHANNNSWFGSHSVPQDYSTRFFMFT